ncbi:MAG: hypothetical protein IV100_07325 [Myxococcales bacterium]|nr:hypothetical protein [Myxococcales bacterium]
MHLRRPLWPLAVVLVIGAVIPGAWAARRLLKPLFSKGGEHAVDIGPIPHGLTATDAIACGTCHQAIAREWRGSLHARAWTDPIFQDAYTLEPLAPCRNCHAPENMVREGVPASPQVPEGAAARDGVSCAGCHVRDGTVLTGMDTGWRASLKKAPHPVKATPALSSSGFCAGCHQFGFLAMVDGRHVETDEVQQDTFGEWQRSRSGQIDETCQDCHMPWVEVPAATASGAPRRYRSHAFIGGFDEGFVRQAASVEVRARLTADGIVAEARFTPGRIGHAFPTGDLFRRAELKVWVDGLPAASATHPLARTFRDFTEPGPKGEPVRVRRQVLDTRVQPPGIGAPSWRTLVIPGAHIQGALAAAGLKTLPEMATLRWTFDYLLMPTPVAASAGGQPVHTIRIDEGAVPLAAPVTPSQRPSTP